MKKLFPFILALTLFLCGCTQNIDPDQTEQSTVMETTTQPGLYVSQSAIEQQTVGAIRRFDLPEQYHAITGVDDRLLLVSQDQNLTFTELLGDECVVGKTVDLPLSTVWKAINTGIVYYDAEQNGIVFLDSQMQELKKVAFPKQIQGDPVISSDGGQVYYCADGEIRVLETEHKISRLIKTGTNAEQKLLGIYFDDSLLACSFTDVDGDVHTEFLSTENGQTLVIDNQITQLYTGGDNFFAIRQDGVIQQKLLGTRTGTPVQLLTDSQIYSALEIGGVVGFRAAESGFDLDFYVIPEGRRTATIHVDGFDAPQAIYADRWNGCLWMLTVDAANGQQVLLCWNLSYSAVSDDASYVGALYTVEAPDVEELNACAERVKQINKAHGVAIRIWQDALKDTNGYTFVPEHQVGAINKTLDQIEQIFGLFPGKFLANSSIKRIRILVVRSINAEVTSTFYWHNSDPTIVLCAGSDVFLGLVKGIGYVVDSNVLGGDAAYGEWDSLNPEGFVYGESSTYSADYLSGDSKAFLSEGAMTSAREDRSQIFYQALMADNANAFSSPIMQSKLLSLCRAIRNTWNLTKKTDIYSWEQYLSESIAYQG